MTRGIRIVPILTLAICPLLASAQDAPFTLTASGVLSSADNAAYPDAMVGAEFSVHYDLVLDTTAPTSITGTASTWYSRGTLTLDIEGMEPVVRESRCDIELRLDPFDDGRNLITFTFNVPSVGWRVARILTDQPIVLADPPRAGIINNADPVHQSNNSHAFRELRSGFVLTGNFTSVTSVGGGPPPPPVITSDPAGDIVDTGDPVTLSVAAEGELLTYQWFKDGAPLTDNADVTGSQTDTLQTTATEHARYACSVSNPTQTLMSRDAVVAVNACKADQNSDGALTPADFTAWLFNYNAGCP